LSPLPRMEADHLELAEWLDVALDAVLAVRVALGGLAASPGRGRSRCGPLSGCTRATRLHGGASWRPWRQCERQACLTTWAILTCRFPGGYPLGTEREFRVPHGPGFAAPAAEVHRRRCRANTWLTSSSCPSTTPAKVSKSMTRSSLRVFVGCT